MADKPTGGGLREHVTHWMKQQGAWEGKVPSPFRGNSVYTNQAFCLAKHLSKDMEKTDYAAGPVRTQHDMNDAEIEAIEKQYNAKVIRDRP